MNAREMFEKLGYEQFYYKNYKIIYRVGNDFDYKHIEFSLDDRTFYCDENYRSKDVTTDELKAIYQQIKELGWLDEKSNS